MEGNTVIDHITECSLTIICLDQNRQCEAGPLITRDTVEVELNSSLLSVT